MHQSNAETPAASSRIAPVPGKTILAANNGGADRGYTEKAMLLGIDLGTSRSSIVSMNGTRKTVESYVGYARDPNPDLDGVANVSLVNSIEAMVKKMKTPRAVWVMVPMKFTLN